MASPTTGTTDIQPRLVYLKYDENGRVTTIPPSNQSNPLLFDTDELVQFVSDSAVAVYMQLGSTKFNPSVFLPGTAVKYIGKQDPQNPVMLKCGYVKVVNGVPTSYGWVPDNVKAATVQYDPKVIYDVPSPYGAFGE